jgi:hypothetical protein
MDNLPEINKKESLVQAAERMFDPKDNRKPGLAH